MQPNAALALLEETSRYKRINHPPGDGSNISVLMLACHLRMPEVALCILDREDFSLLNGVTFETLWPAGRENEEMKCVNDGG